VCAFWYWKGWDNIKTNNYLNAIECLKQTLINDENHFLSIFTIACLYELLGFYKTSLEWFELCLSKKKYKKKVYFGLALCHFKQQQYPSASNYLNKIFQYYKVEGIRSEYLYLQILNHKKTGESKFNIVKEYKYFEDK